MKIGQIVHVNVLNNKRGVNTGYNGKIREVTQSGYYVSPPLTKKSKKGYSTTMVYYSRDEVEEVV